MQRLYPIVGWICFTALMVAFVSKEGSEWEFGPHGFIKTLVAEDGRHYPNGKEIEASVLWLVENGYEEAFQLILVGSIGLTAVVSMYLPSRKRSSVDDAIFKDYRRICNCEYDRRKGV
jgi:hypothetical protein